MMWLKLDRRLGDYKRGGKPEVPPISFGAFRESFALAKKERLAKEVEDLRKANNELHLALKKQK